MRIVRFAAVAAACLSLAGCSFIPGLSTAGMTAKAFAVTRSNQGITTAQVTLSWPSVSNAALYQITRKVGVEGAYAPLDSVEGTRYLDIVMPNKTLAYTINALNPSGETVQSVEGVPVTVMDAGVGKPTGLVVDGTPVTNGSATIVKSKPTLAWSAAASASAYYVTLNQVEEGGKVGKVVFGAITRELTATVGTLPLKEVAWDGFTQIQGDSLVKGRGYLFRVTAIRTDAADLAKATAIDVAVGDDTAKLGFF